jgi:signal transduction histidine kinase
MKMKPSDTQKKILRRILIIDDNPDIHQDFAMILTPRVDMSKLEELETELFGREKPAPQRRGPIYDLDFASQGQQGLEKVKSALAQEMPYQLAFIDMRMPPGWDGLRTIEEIWAVDPEIQVVICTAFSDYSWEDISQRLGMNENLLILKKPFDSSEVSQLASTLTEKWALARQAKINRDELERQVARRTKALRESNQQLKKEMAERKALEEQLLRSQKMEAIGTLAAGVAHDLNNILSGILSYPDLLLTQMKESDPMHRPLSVIRKSSRKAAAIVQDLLTLARRHVAVMEPLDLLAVVRNFIDGPECGAILEYHPHVRIVPTFEMEAVAVSGSSVHLEKMVMNLVSNAAEAMGDGGTLRLEVSSRQLTEPPPGYSGVKPGHYARLLVSDEGVGISPEDIGQLFEPFFTRKKMGRSGTGLGMTVVWDTVNQHKGYIEVDSKQGCGTSIAVYLPITDQELVPSQDASAHENLKGDGEHILVVDDVPEQREIATAIFEELGYTSDAVKSGESALEYLERQQADLLLLDMIMDPGMDGLETLRRVLARHPDQKAVIASGYTKNERVREALKLGATFINKPYQLQEIAKAVRARLKGR